MALPVVPDTHVNSVCLVLLTVSSLFNRKEEDGFHTNYSSILWTSFIHIVPITKDNGGSNNLQNSAQLIVHGKHNLSLRAQPSVGFESMLPGKINIYFPTNTSLSLSCYSSSGFFSHNSSSWVHTYVDILENKKKNSSPESTLNFFVMQREVAPNWIFKTTFFPDELFGVKSRFRNWRARAHCPWEKRWTMDNFCCHWKIVEPKKRESEAGKTKRYSFDNCSFADAGIASVVALLISRLGGELIAAEG